MRTIKINEELYDRLERISKFIGQEINSLAEGFIRGQIEVFEKEPMQILEYYLTNEQCLKLIFGPGYKK